MKKSVKEDPNVSEVDVLADLGLPHPASEDPASEEEALASLVSKEALTSQTQTSASEEAVA